MTTYFVSALIRTWNGAGVRSVERIVEAENDSDAIEKAWRAVGFERIVDVFISVGACERTFRIIEQWSSENRAMAYLETAMGGAI